MYIGFIASIIALVGIDQFTKYLAVTKLKPIRDYPLIKNVLHLTYVENKGAAFGILEGKQNFFIIITVVVVVVASFYYGQLPKTKIYNWIRLALILLVAGAIGNIIDRIRYGYVVDFIYIKLINFAVFNFADICVVVGVIILSVFTLFIKEDSEI